MSKGIILGLSHSKINPIIQITDSIIDCMIYSQLSRETHQDDSVPFQRFPKSQYLPFEHPGFATAAIHAGQSPELIHGSINTPVYLSSTFVQKGLNEFTSDFHYTRCGNPTTSALEKCMKQLQYGEYSLCFSSYCGALSSLFHLVGSKDHVIICENIYASIRRYTSLFSEERFGVEIDYVDMTDISNIKNKIKGNTKLILTESPVNPTMVIHDLEAIAKLGKEHNILTAVDNSFACSYLQSPLLLGIDVSMISCSKYLGGHSDVVLGVMVTNNRKVYEDMVLVAQTQGTTPSAFESYLVLRSIKTLEIRVTRECQNAYTIAHFLESHPMVQKVYYPGLKSHPQHELANRQMRGFGGVVSFDLKGEQKQCSVFFKALKVFKFAESFGSVESLTEYPYTMSYIHYPGFLDTIGVTNKMIRLAAGIECLQDLIQDLNQALRKVAESK